ncbi:MAG: DNA polymerase III subunit delta [Deltaproteobacteria bacterium RIFCSPLOWO2_02_FULL_50_16]|nr:MAG: DNA polymerase III subunit delta [Deltaproteobacteria bacterium GWA2_50_8]OGQ26658.1 MAG: DNA polymerase III subunit delta [Deltaproteobacteria bacterium RIFCSPHIGHO2_02_FULL_50_15]OGQ57774.1 MAG: DNA polymerase III subunit delta [Deltaproteobacteria bacterium RIFCSPLOWO2_02_FULL_50_16]OGQ68764.1 MAG: DNA polymerase III subunit delta [Deltaproteobacteria bacterium RIFCSPLOWO2_12_FULL_50_11]
MIYLLYGAESFLLDRFLASLESNVLKGGIRDFNRDLFSGKTATAKSIIEASLTLPMMAEKRMILVREAEFFNKNDQEKLMAATDQIPETTVLVFVAHKIDRRQLFWQHLIKKANVKPKSETSVPEAPAVLIREFKPLYPREIPSWIHEESRRMSVTLDPEAIQILVELIGTHLVDLSYTLEKLILYASPRQSITIEDVEAVICDVAVRSVFDLADAIGQGNWGRSLYFLEKILVSSEEPALRVLSLILRHFRILLKAKEAETKRMPQMELARFLGVSPYFVNNYQSQAQRMTRAHILQTMEILYQTDKSLKRSFIPDLLIMERMIFSLAAERGNLAAQAANFS